MSMLGRARIKGSTVTTKRATRVVAANRTSRAQWADVATGLRVTLRQSTNAREQKVWGREISATYLARVPLGTDVKPDDGWTVTAGPSQGENLKVLDAITIREGPKHLLVALLKTEDGFAA